MPERESGYNLEALLSDPEFKWRFYYLLIDYIIGQKYPQYIDEKDNLFTSYPNKYTGLNNTGLNDDTKHLKIIEVAQELGDKLQAECKTIGDFKEYCARPYINVKFPDEQQLQLLISEVLTHMPKRQTDEEIR